MSEFDPFTSTWAEAWAQPADSLAIARWGAAQQLLANREHFELNPLDGLAVCCTHNLVAPEWLASAFLKGFHQVVRYEAASWDAAFGRPHPKGINLARAKQRRRLRLAIWYEAMESARLHPERPLTEAIEQAGLVHGAGRTLADELYREECAERGFGALKLRAAALRARGSAAQPARLKKLAGRKHKP